MAKPPPPPTRIVNSGRGHSYYLDGEKVKGVTTILSDGVPKPGLIGWGAGTVADFVVNRLNIARNPEGQIRIVADELVHDALEWNASRGSHAVAVGNDALPRLGLAEILKNIRYRDLDEASGRGTEVHRLGEKLARGETVIAPPELAGHVQNYAKFLREWRPANAILEGVVVNRTHRYMGRFDMIADFPGVWTNGPWQGEPVGTGLVDLKTARSGIFAEVALQLVAYKEGEFLLGPEGAELEMPKVDWVGAIHVRADGYDVHAFEIDASTFRTFLYIKAVGDWLDWRDGPAATIKTDSLAPPTE